MPIDLGDLVEPLQREVNPPGTPTISATDEQWIGYLADAFWTARLRGAFAGYEEDEGLIVPTSGTTDLSREMQQLIVLFAGYRILLRAIQNAQTVFRAQAGPVEFETQQSAQVLRGVLAAIEAEMKEILNLVTGGSWATTVAYFDAVISRTTSIGDGESWFVR